MTATPIKQGIKYSFGTPAIGLGLSMFTFGAFLKVLALLFGKVFLLHFLLLLYLVNL